MADDDSSFLGVTKFILEDAGFAVEIAEDGESALKKIRKRKYDLLVLGVVMPKIDGIKLLQMVPVLLVSDYLSKEELTRRQREIAGKPQGHIQKPFMIKTFLEMVAALLGKNGNVGV